MWLSVPILSVPIMLLFSKNMVLFFRQKHTFSSWASYARKNAENCHLCSFFGQLCAMRSNMLDLCQHFDMLLCFLTLEHNGERPSKAGVIWLCRAMWDRYNLCCSVEFVRLRSDAWRGSCRSLRTAIIALLVFARVLCSWCWSWLCCC